MKIESTSIPESIRKAMARPTTLVTPGTAQKEYKRLLANPDEMRRLEQAYRAVEGKPTPSRVEAPPCPTDAVQAPRVQKIPKARVMNKTEKRFSEMLEDRLHDREIQSWRYEGLRLKWGGCMNYTADFVVFHGGDVTLYEVKGAHIRDRDIVRFKGCRNEWKEFSFELWQWKNGKWTQKY